MGNPFALCIRLLKLNDDNNVNTITIIILLQGFLEHLLCAARLLLRQPRFV
jgi:hypothetical protein